MKLEHVALVGYGEVGKIFATGLLPHARSVATWDIKFDAADLRGVELAHAVRSGVTACGSLPELCAGADLVISAVTASNTLAVAQAAAAQLRVGTVFLDLNSASPATKQEAGKLIDGAGGRYVEAGVMTSVPPYGIRVPMLLGGTTAAELEPRLQAWGMDVRAVSDRLGVASAIKMCRSVMIKGLEALVIESFATARAYGVEDDVIATLQETFPSIDWQQQGAYFFSRVVQHGQRRAEEMREAANTVREAGFEPVMGEAIAAKQQQMADHSRAGLFNAIEKGARWQDYADRLLAGRHK